MARPKKEIDPKKVEQLAMVGCPPNEIAAELDCHVRSIHRRFATVVKKGAEKGKTRIRSQLFKMAMQGNLGATIFLAKAWCGMKEPQDPAVSVNVSAMATAAGFQFSEEQKAELVKAIETLRRKTVYRKQEPIGNGNGDQTATEQPILN